MKSAVLSSTLDVVVVVVVVVTVVFVVIVFVVVVVLVALVVIVAVVCVIVVVDYCRHCCCSLVVPNDFFAILNVCLVPEPKCTICLGEQVFSSGIYSNDENATTTSDVNKSSQNAEQNK